MKGMPLQAEVIFYDVCLPGIKNSFCFLGRETSVVATGSKASVRDDFFITWGMKKQSPEHLN